jgi:hypothetical protein
MKTVERLNPTGLVLRMSIVKKDNLEKYYIASSKNGCILTLPA